MPFFGNHLAPYTSVRNFFLVHLRRDKHCCHYNLLGMVGQRRDWDNSEQLSSSKYSWGSFLSASWEGCFTLLPSPSTFRSIVRRNGQELQHRSSPNGLPFQKSILNTTLTNFLIKSTICFSKSSQWIPQVNSGKTIKPVETSTAVWAFLWLENALFPQG